MALIGNEILYVNGIAENGQLAATLEPTTTAAIAALAATDSAPFIQTPITTVGNGTLTAASLIKGEVLRSGPVAAFTDTTDTAANIIAGVPGFIAGQTFFTYIKNTTAFYETLAAGTGVTLPATVIIPPFSLARYLVVLNNSTTVTFAHMNTTPITTGAQYIAPTLVADTTVGADTIVAAAFASGFTARSGSTAAFTDTTDTATNIIAAQGSIVGKIGSSFLYTYVNNTVAIATLTGGTGVTVSGITAVPANSWAQYLITYTAANTLTMVGVMQGYFPSTGTYINNGATPVTVANAAVTANSVIVFTLKTVGGTVSASAPNVKTITPGTGFTVAGLASDTSTYNYEIRG